VRIYRCIHKTELMLLMNDEQEKLLDFMESRKTHKNVGKGFNTFDYSDGKPKVHFYLYAQSAKACQVSLKEEAKQYALIQYELPYDSIKELRGYGYYADIYKSFHIPIPEFALGVEEYSFEHITAIKAQSCLSWYNIEYYKYIRKLPRQVMSVNALFGEPFLPGYSKNTILKAPFEEICGIKPDTSISKPKIKVLHKKVNEVHKKSFE